MLVRHFGETPDGPGLDRLIDYYLSERAYRLVASGCPLPGLSGEASRMPPGARERFEAGILKFRERIGQALAAMGRDDADSLAASVLAELVGAMILARSLSDETTALALLAASRTRIKERVGLA